RAANGAIRCAPAFAGASYCALHCLFVQIDRDVGHVGAARLDVDRLRAAARVDGDAGGKPGALDERRDVRPADAPRQIPGYAAGRLRPRAGHARAVGLDVAADLEFVAVARTGER